MTLVLSLFPGGGLLDRAFEEAGYCVVRGPDPLWGGDVRRFSPPALKFQGIIGGPPCQTFSALSNLMRAKGVTPAFGNLIPEFERCVEQAKPYWFVMENVRRAPLPLTPSYALHSQLLNNRSLGERQNRVRRITFGVRGPDIGVRLEIQPVALEHIDNAPAVTSAKQGERRNAAGKRQKIHRYTVAAALAEQGLPPDFFKHSPFTQRGQLKMIANGVPMAMGRAIAAAVAVHFPPRSERPHNNAR